MPVSWAAQDVALNPKPMELAAWLDATPPPKEADGLEIPEFALAKEMGRKALAAVAYCAGPPKLD